MAGLPLDDVFPDPRTAATPRRPAGSSASCCRERVEVAWGGGHGRTGTALASIVVLDGVPACEAVLYVRKHCDPRAVETPWQRRCVANFHAP